MRYEFLLFDADNTLFDFDTGERNAFSAALQAFDIEEKEEYFPLYLKANRALWKQYERGEIEKSDIFALRFHNFGKSAGLALPALSLNDCYLTLLGQESVLLPYAEELLQALSHKGYRMYIITNGDKRVQASRFAQSPITPYFEKIFISEEMGYAKPSVRFFELAAQAIEGFDKSRALVIGDSETGDILGANNFGVDACHVAINSPPLSGIAHAEYTVSSLRELEVLLCD